MTADQAERMGEPPRSWFGFDIGPTFSVPLPAASASRDEIGLDVGLSCTLRTAPNLGIGADIAYHYWPVSAEFKRVFNEFLREQTFNTLKLGGGAWGLQVIQLGGHVRAEAPVIRGARPWLQVGVSLYRVDPNTTGYSGDAGFFTVIAPPLERRGHVGISVAAGTDLFGRPHARMGVDATYHYVSCGDRYGEDLRVVTVGTRVLLSW